MARTSKPNSGADKARGAGRSDAGRRVPNERVIEDGIGEQGNERIAGKPSARAKMRENDRHGGIPLGADPRE